MQARSDRAAVARGEVASRPLRRDAKLGTLARTEETP
jgi:hypothetical protein